MYDPPEAGELLAAVRSFLEQKALPALEGHTAFHARVAINALAIVERQLAQAEPQEAAEAERLVALLGQEGDLDTQNRELCRRIRAGEIDAGTAGLSEHLWETTLAKLAVDQPKYASYRRALERRSGSG